MIGRAPEYLREKIEIQEMELTAIAILITPYFNIARNNTGARGFSEVLYAFSSAANNNGSAFAGLNSNNLFYNITLSIVMFVGRFGLITAIMAIAGIMVGKQRRPESFATLPTYGPLYIGLLILTVFVIGALTFVPAPALGPIAKDLQLWHSAQ